jgi:hypothetical protein
MCVRAFVRACSTKQDWLGASGQQVTRLRSSAWAKWQIGAAVGAQGASVETIQAGVVE